MNEHGGLGLTCLIVFFSAVGGMLQSAFQWLDSVTRNITGPQATLIIGAVGFTFQYGPRAARWAFERVKARRAKK